MSDSERPIPLPPKFEVPDLELEPPRSIRRAAPAAVAPTTRVASAAPDQMLGATFDFGDELGDFELERVARPNDPLASAPSAAAARVPPRSAEATPRVPTGRALEPAKLEFDAHELARLADYGVPPDNAALSLAYAYRVFTRQRALKHQLAPLAAECARAESEREAVLAELARAVRPALEQISEFHRFFAPVLQVEERAAARGQALSSINAELGAQHAALEAELSRVKSQIEIEQRSEIDARRSYDEREADAKRAEAKLKRAQIEIRAVRQVAERTRDAPGGPTPDAEAARLAQLTERAQALQPDVHAANDAFERADLALRHARSRLEALQREERQISRKQQALGSAYRPEIAARAESLSEVESEHRAALAELARAVLAAGTIPLPDAWLERVRSASDHADALSVRAEKLRRAIACYDVPRARQGVRLACTAVAITFVLLVFKLIF